MQEAKILRAGRLTSKPEPVHIRPQILVNLQRGRGRPVRVAPVRPGSHRPAWVHERRGFGDFQVRVHLPQDCHDFGLGLFVRLPLDAVGFFRDDCDENYVRLGNEAWRGQGLPDGVVAAGGGICVEEVLGVAGPEGLVELEEDLGVGAHVELFDGGLLPVREGWRERDGVVLEDAQRERADCVGGGDAAAVFLVDDYAVIGIGDVGDD